MKTLIVIISLSICLQLRAQHELVNNAAQIYIGNGATLAVKGSFTNQTGSVFTNHGTATFTGSITNNQVMSSYSGKLVLQNSTAQTLNGTTDFLTKDVEIDNPAGVTLQTLLKVDGVCHFVNGIITTAAVTAPLSFTANGSVTGVSDASHVNGYVVKEGPGLFSYPVGDGSRHQVVEVNATANASGIRVQYTPGNAGNGSFSGPNPLLYYNTREYWNITPLSTATASVTIHWDDYHNIGIGNTADLRVAHYTGGTWVNEAAITSTGSTSAGTVTSQPISAWSPFTLGSVSSSSTLPVSWLRVSGILNAQQQAVIDWKVNEYQVSDYQVEKSSNARQFTSIARLKSKGAGTQHYQYIDPQSVIGTAYYRIKQTDHDGTFSYSPVIKLQMPTGSNLGVYPIPFEESFTIISPVAQTARLTTLDGKLVRLLTLQQGSNLINSGLLSKGIYLILTSTAPARKIIKN